MSEERSFIEVQFPVSKISKESYKERKAVQSQTLTGLGKWWGRKPLILVRASILGLLIPASNDPNNDREIFLKLLTMDEASLKRRRTKNFTAKELFDRLEIIERKKWFDAVSTEKKPVLKKLSPEERRDLQEYVFARLSYDEKLNYCDRPEQLGGPLKESWADINAHLETTANSLAELIQQLGNRRFGRNPVVGDSFCGGGSVPFEAARIGCSAYAADLNPVAVMLTWASLNIIGGGKDAAERAKTAQRKVFAVVEAQINKWGIERNERDWRADAYLYCTEITCPECGMRVPLSPTWVVGETSQTVAQLVLDKQNSKFDIQIINDATPAQMKNAKESGTLKEGAFVCPNSRCAAHVTPITVNLLRDQQNGPGSTGKGLRLWENRDVVSSETDVFRERLYCIRWTESYIDENGNPRTKRHFRAPEQLDWERERKVEQLLAERFDDWQEKGYIPSRQIESGDETTRLTRERGWTHWHHLFTPRQLLLHGLLSQAAFSILEDPVSQVAVMLGVGRCTNWNSRLCQWGVGAARESIAQTFYNQALNTFYNYAGKALPLLAGSFFIDFEVEGKFLDQEVMPLDARETQKHVDIWITDPPYADAVNYHELSEFFLAWYDKNLKRVFPEWYSDSKRALAITGEAESFRKSMAECYRKLAEHMPDNGLQLVMFTHQSAAVWADLALILWAAGLRVTAAWCIATETNSALKEGNYVQGTVLLVLRKQITDDTAFLDEIYPRVDEEVRRQLAEMSALDDKEDPNFSDTDYQLAAYAAALRVLTSYRRIEEIDVQRELVKVRAKGEVSPLEEVIREAVKIACNYQIPTGLDKEVWRGLSADERFYIKGLELESHGEYRTGAYQEFAKGFGIKEYSFMLSSGKANQTRLKTASEFAGRNLGGEGFASSLTRHALYAVRETAASGETVDGRNWFRNELGARYWAERKNLVGILNYFASFAHSANMPQWQKDSGAAKLLAVAVENDHV